MNVEKILFEFNVIFKLYKLTYIMCTKHFSISEQSQIWMRKFKTWKVRVFLYLAWLCSIYSLKIYHITDRFWILDHYNLNIPTSLPCLLSDERKHQSDSLRRANTEMDYSREREDRLKKDLEVSHKKECFA